MNELRIIDPAMRLPVFLIRAKATPVQTRALKRAMMRGQFVLINDIAAGTIQGLKQLSDPFSDTPDLIITLQAQSSPGGQSLGPEFTLAEAKVIEPKFLTRYR